MKKIMAVVGLASVLTGAVAQSVTVNIPAVDIFVNTWVYVTNGEVITINVNGNWSVHDGVDGIYGNIFGVDADVPDGIYETDSDMFLNNGIKGAVVGHIGDVNSPYISGGSDSYPATNGFFEVGSSRQIISDTNGWLWLGIQDDATSVGDPSDNDGSMTAQIFMGGGATNSNWTDMRPEVSVSGVSDIGFGFNIAATNTPNSFWAVYDSTDLKNWVLVGAVTLDDNGYGSFTNTTGVPYRFYKVSNGQTTSRAIGYVRLTIPAGSTNLIADQLLYGANTLNDVLPQILPDGVQLPVGTRILKWSGSDFVTYLWDGTSWSPNGNVPLSPGNGAMLINPGDEYKLTFVGTIPEGNCDIVLPLGRYTSASAMVPRAGGILSVLGFTPEIGDTIYQWGTNQYIPCTYLGNANLTDFPDGWISADGNDVTEPLVHVGESFFIFSGGDGTEYWDQSYPPINGLAP